MGIPGFIRRKFSLILINFFIKLNHVDFMRNDTMIVPVRVERITLDTTSNRFVVILKDDVNRRWLPIVVGPAEAQAIALQLENVRPPRPMTHDLMRNLLESIDTGIVKVVVNALKDNTYYATIDLKKNGSQKQVDARPSDAIALALRMNAPIFVHEDVMRKAAITEEQSETPSVTEDDRIRHLSIQLQQAVEEERYEDAAKLRDQITEMKTPNRDVE